MVSIAFFLPALLSRQHALAVSIVSECAIIRFANIKSLLINVINNAIAIANTLTTINIAYAID